MTHRAYTGDIAYAAGMLSSGALLLRQEANMLEQRPQVKGGEHG